jgi:uncharacterized membrane protein (UPF0127 family)
MGAIVTMVRLLRSWCLALSVAGIVQGAGAADMLPTIPLSIIGHKITVEVAATPDRRAMGLMHRFSLQPDHGMVFVFERPEPQGFWMKSTFIPLSIVFVDRRPHPQRRRNVAARREHAFVARTCALRDRNAQGWFTERGIKSGDLVKGLPEPRR